jgi:F-type H+-transporting ATPase subunit delta
MSGRRTNVLHHRYAKALLGLEGDRSALGEKLDGLVKVLDEVPELERRLDSPLLPKSARRQQARALADSLELGPDLGRFLELLVERGRVEHLRGILASWRDLVDAEAGLVRARVVSAAPLAPEQQRKLELELGRLRGATVCCQFETDAALLGGCVIRMEDLVLDGSVSGRLVRLRRSLLENHQVEG